MHPILRAIKVWQEKVTERQRVGERETEIYATELDIKVKTFFIWSLIYDSDFIKITAAGVI